MIRRPVLGSGYGHIRASHSLSHALRQLVGRQQARWLDDTTFAVDQDRILARRDAWEASQTQLDQLSEWCRTIASQLSDFDYNRKRLALEALGVQVEVFRHDHDPRYVITAGIPITDTGALAMSPSYALRQRRDMQHKTVTLRWTDHDVIPVGGG